MKFKLILILGFILLLSGLVSSADWDITNGTRFTFDSTKGEHNSLVQIDSTHYLNTYAGEDIDGYAVVLIVNETDWSITKGTAHEFDTDRGDYNSLIQIDSTHYLNTYWGRDFIGKAVVLTVNQTDWTVSGNTSINFSNALGQDNSLVQIDSTHYLNTYKGTDSDGYAIVLTVNPADWTITKETAFEFASDETLDYNSLVQINSTHYLNTYTNVDSDGYAVVLIVNETDWSITKGIANEFDELQGQFNSLVQIDSTHYLNTYKGTDSDGYAVVLIVNETDLTITKETPFEFDITNNGYNSLVQIDSTHYLNTYTGVDNDGYAIVLIVNETDWSITKGTAHEFQDGTVALDFNSLVQIDSTHYLNTYAYDDNVDGHAIVLTVEVPNPYFDINLNDIYNLTTINEFSVNVNNTNYSTTTGNIITNILFNNNLTYNVTIFNVTNYYNRTIEVPLNASYEASIYPYTKIYSTNKGVYIDNFNITTIYGEQETTIGVINLPIYNETIETYIHNANNGTNYYNYDIVNLTGSPYLENYTFTLSDFNSVNVTIYSEETGDLVTENITINVINELGQTSYNRINSSLYLKELLSGEYTFTFISDEYSSRSYIITVSDGSTQNLNAYLLNSSDTVVFTSKDQSNGAILEDVTYSISTLVNDEWKIVSVKKSDIVGEVSFAYYLDKLYSFTTSLNGYESKTFELNPILNSAYTIWLNPTDEYNLTDSYSAININYLINPTYGINNITIINGRFQDNLTNNFTFVISAPEGDLISYGYELEYDGNIKIETGLNAYGDTLNSNLSITGSTVIDTVSLKYYYTSTLSGYHEFNERFSISGTPQNGLIIKLKNQQYGLGILERVLIVMVIVALFAGLIGLFNGEVAGGISAIFIMAYFLSTGFLEIWFLVLPVVLIFSWIIWRSE